MKKTILSLAALCMLTAFSSAKLMSVGSNVNKKLNGTTNLLPLPGMTINLVSPWLTLAPITYRNLKSDAGYVEIEDLTTGINYESSLPPTGNTPVDTPTPISLTVGDVIDVTVYSGNGDCSITCNGSTETGVSSLYLSNNSFEPDPSWIVIQ
jgi:hypothetical protein